MPSAKRPGWTKHNVRVPDATFESFDQARKAKKMTRTAALDQAMREWTERQAAAGGEADLLAPVLEQLLQRQLHFLEERLVKLMVKNGVLSATAVELFLEQRRRNGHDTSALMKDIKDRVFRRWKDPSTFADAEPDPKSWGNNGESA